MPDLTMRVRTLENSVIYVYQMGFPYTVTHHSGRKQTERNILNVFVFQHCSYLINI